MAAWLDADRRCPLSPERGFFEWVSNIDGHDRPPQDSEDTMSSEQRRLAAAGVSPGTAAFKDLCMSCHSLGGSGGSIGPALEQAGAKYDEATIAGSRPRSTSWL